MKLLFFISVLFFSFFISCSNLSKREARNVASFDNQLATPEMVMIEVNSEAGKNKVYNGRLVAVNVYIDEKLDLSTESPVSAIFAAHEKQDNDPETSVSINFELLKTGQTRKVGGNTFNQWKGYFSVPYYQVIKKEQLSILIKEKIESSSWFGSQFNFKSYTINQTLEVIKYAYRFDGVLWVTDVNTIKPDQATQQLIEIQRQKLKIVYGNAIKEKLWESFQYPRQSFITSPYGNFRNYNNMYSDFHSGVDFAADARHDIKAAGRGKVVLMEHLHYTGYTVILDHGTGIFTIYAHLSKFDPNLTLNSIVPIGTVLGKAGSTGRATGPHLHWGAKIKGYFFDPLILLNLNAY